MKSGALEAFLLALSGAASLGGLYFLWRSASYVLDFLSPSQSQIDNELLGGAYLALLMSWPFWAIVSALTFPIRNRFSRRTLFVVNAPTIGTLLVLLSVMAVQIAFILLDHH